MLERMLFLLKKQGKKQSYIEEKLGSYRGKVTEWKNGKSSPTNEEIKVIAELLDTTEAYLLGETDDPSPRKLSPEEEIVLDELQFALYTATNKLTDKQKRILVDLAKNMNEQSEQE